MTRVETERPAKVLAPLQAARDTARQEVRRNDGHGVRVRLARQWMRPELAARMKVGSVLQLDCAESAPAEVFVDGRLLGTGSLVAVGGMMGIRLDVLAAAAS